MAQDINMKVVCSPRSSNSRRQHWQQELEGLGCMDRHCWQVMLQPGLVATQG
jgi:hypothetical protein